MTDTTISSAASVDTETTRFFLQPTRREFVRVCILGAAIGLLIPLIGFLLEKFFIEPVFCHTTNSFGVCATGGLVAYYISATLLGVAAIVLLANWQVFRPLLIVFATAAALWGLQKYLPNMTVNGSVEYYSFSMIFYALAYLIFYLLLRIRSFGISIVLTIAVVAAIRWVLIS